jgi:hypothetical protein
MIENVKEAISLAEQASESANVLLNSSKGSKFPSDILAAINQINQSLPVLLAWLKEEHAREGLDADEIIKRNEELGEEIRTANQEDIDANS